MFIGAGSTFYAFDASGCGAGTCDPVWTAPTACDRFNTSPTVGASLVYAPCGNGDVYVYEATTGKELAHWEFETTGYPWRTPVVAAGKHLFVVPTFGFKVQMLSLP
jgi:outer membrane protein assembly factor BamB